ncbi:hypothetical protein A3B32_02360 [Candidatus Uhrbacteria bacterium RIFCSPLOWO2_01_FULL_53_9]|uniref:Phosphoribosyl-ATP pyrophosphohydrolase n=3 Tax=Candidatus Uhriibacteriota TaxID=1752732 RepID=A0A1F7UZ54_9BACT|nr:MAG: hypothetical protein A3C17_03185 [Candidatus Uhrbacteria bacterium RIFCSPHIGHO2_02_FULL_53_13]OGL83565.1 MAG: hypothetical protein A3B32_02360 [Candidatus Uhrbacteria bacterium RIFCSPLOWO2_01_FULL_53_9]OGL89193.1 MAG: hypothetical protein A3I45_01115 [Candidatus Uhrbacteria bacterium RIFCSPLOWO2_02_FULL_53_10]
MSTVEYHKLVRDRIPEIIRLNGAECATRIATQEEYCDLLRQKLQEEVNEFLEHNDPNELADVLEVMHALCEVLGVSFDDIESARLQKAQERGGFLKRIFLESTTE